MERIEWQDAGETFRLAWRSLAGLPPPARVVPADDAITADAAFRLASQGSGLLWRGDYHGAKHLLEAMARRIDRERRASADGMPDPQAFHRHRAAQAQRARTLGRLLIPLADDYAIPLRRAPDVRQACQEAYGDWIEPCAISLRELLGVIGAHEWQRKGVFIPALGAHIHPHYGVFSPLRGEYLDLVAAAPLPAGAETAFDIGTGSAVIAAILARRGIARIVATDTEPRALACAADNLARLGLGDRVELKHADLFPEGRASLVVCNPPWLPGRASTLLERASYDPDSRMLKGFLHGLAEHLLPGGEGWLILSDFAERIGLRREGQLQDLIAAGGLRVLSRLETRPRHARASNPLDPLHFARSAEVTSLWRLAPAI